MKYVFFFSVVLFGALGAQADDNLPYWVTCQATETADMKDSIRRNLFRLLDEIPNLREKSVQVRIVQKNGYELRTLDELVSGLQFAMDPSTLNVSVGGDIDGHRCFIPSDVHISVKAKRRTDGQVIASDFTLSSIRIPGSFAVKRKIIMQSDGTYR